MLAKIDWDSNAPREPVAEIEYNGFPRWCALLVEPNREIKSAEWLKKVNVHVYLPLFKKSYCRRGGRRYRRDCAVMPGLMFAPTVSLDFDDRERVFEWAHIRGFIRTAGRPIILTKADIEAIRRIEAKLNCPDKPVDARGIELAVGQRVRFIDSANERLFGETTVFEVARDNRIGIEVSGLFGIRTKAHIAAAEIEVM